MVLTIAMYIRFEWTMKHYILEIHGQIMWTGPYILMASSTITILVSFLGCWGTVHENPFLLRVVRIVFQTCTTIIVQFDIYGIIKYENNTTSYYICKYSANLPMTGTVNNHRTGHKTRIECNVYKRIAREQFGVKGTTILLGVK